MKAKLPVLVATLLGAATLPHLLAEVTITQHPTHQVVSLNAHVTNSVTATSTAQPLTYQWYGKGALLPDQTSRTLVLNNIQLDQAGAYYVVNDAHNQPVQSNPANVMVDLRFIKITEGPLVTDVEPTESSTWWDYDDNGYPDVLVHLVSDIGPGVFQSFYHNNGDGTFTKITTNAIAQNRKNCLIGTVGDYDNDGDQDIYTTCNYRAAGESIDDLFRNDGDGRFTARRDEPWRQDFDKSFDCSFVDLDRDGWLDVFVQNYSQPGRLYRQTLNGQFQKLTATEVGSILNNPGASGNAAWADFDNDGCLDLFLTCGMSPTDPEANPRQFYRAIAR